MVPLHFGHHAPGPIPTPCLIQKTGIPDHRRVRGPAHRTGQQWLDVPQQRIIARQADGLLETPGFQILIELRVGKGGNDYDQLENEDTAHLLIDVVCFIHPPKRLPDKISLHIISHSENWRFLENHDFTIRFDDKKLSPGDLAYANKVLSDATVNEQIWPDFTLDQFRQIAWADKVYFKLGYKNYEIPTVTRQKWKLLWKYLDLMKAGQDVDLKKAIGEKP